MHLQKAKIPKLNFSKEWHMDTEKKTTILKDFFCAYNKSFQSVSFLIRIDF